MNDNKSDLWMSLWYAAVALVAGAGCYLLMRFGASILNFLINGVLP